MTQRRHGRRVDDWFRPVNADGTMAARRRPVTPRDRRFMLGYVLVGLLALAVVFLRFEPGRAFAISGGIIGMVLVQVVTLCRTRAAGFGARRP